MIESVLELLTLGAKLMKQILLTLLIFLQISLFATDITTNDKLKKEVTALKSKISILENDLKEAKNKIIEIESNEVMISNNKANIEKNVLGINNNKVSLESTNIKNIKEHYDLVFSNWLTVQGFLVGLLGLLAILLPLLTYFFAFKPARDAEKKLEDIENNIEKNIDHRISEYLLDREEMKLKDAINKLFSTNPEEKSYAVRYINLNPTFNISLDLTATIFEKLIDNIIDNQQRLILENLITIKKNIFADQYFTFLLDSSEEKIQRSLAFIIRYMVLNELDDINFIIKIVQKFNQPMQAFLQILAHVASQSKIYAMKILNLQELIELLNDGVLVVLKNTIESYGKQFDFNYEESLIYKAVKDL